MRHIPSDIFYKCYSNFIEIDKLKQLKSYLHRFMRKHFQIKRFLYAFESFAYIFTTELCGKQKALKYSS